MSAGRILDMLVLAAASVVAEMFGSALGAVGARVTRDAVAHQAFAILFVGAGTAVAAVIRTRGFRTSVAHPAELAAAFAAVQAHAVVGTTANGLPGAIVLAAVVAALARGALTPVVHALAESLGERTIARARTDTAGSAGETRIAEAGAIDAHAVE
jgi:hypothetical protein